ncbi:MAG: dihydroneopterin aldolase [Puniceicoccales bacterium]|jgi:dihydroneopterin aldolase|nr:dihydroneopterin aldolase [Puniceicoccales bacterium]
MDKIRINGIKAYGHHGALPEETRLGQPFKVSLELAFDTRPAAAADDLALTVDYAAAIRRVEDTLKGPPVRLIETLAGRIADAILRDFPLVQEVTVEVQKPFAPVAADFDGLAIVITRSRHP